MIDFIDVSKRYNEDDGYVFEHFNLHIERGEMVALIGTSGIGKTTLLNMLLKDIEPTSGEIMVDDVKLSKLRGRRVPYYRRELGVIFQDYKLIPELTAYENVQMAMIGAGGWNKNGYKRISSIFSMLGIARLHNKKPDEMSGGEQQKICLARAIVNFPRILIADEPTGNLDPKSSDEIFALLRLINNQGITVIVSTHDYERIMDTGWRVIELNESNGFRQLSRKLTNSEAKNYE